MVGLAIFGFVSILLYANKMPLAVQRAISFLPVNVDSEVQADAMGSTEWRMQMWAIAWKDVPKYLFIGKGYSIDPTEMDLTKQAIRMGIFNSSEESILAGDYHSGPLTVLIPIGIFGAAAFLWALIAGFRVLYSNYRYGDAALRRINSVLLSFYLANVVSFFLIFGSLSSQLYIFMGAIGLGVSLNGGVKRKPKSITDSGRASQPQAFAIEVG
jgi:hypothetical protein